MILERDLGGRALSLNFLCVDGAINCQLANSLGLLTLLRHLHPQTQRFSSIISEFDPSLLVGKKFGGDRHDRISTRTGTDVEREEGG